MWQGGKGELTDVCARVEKGESGGAVGLSAVGPGRMYIPGYAGSGRGDRDTPG